ncbi:Viral late transcription elongation factor [Sea otter poxvirus]|uniref:Late transcription elongation factor OPG087 n=1 Tax=Sea otter poxvirus TaxID=1416741 RepID=A0A2U9QHP6_9POXV|nr:Viral late transcription elongation factor [Sea otter poxvirus]AWU47097.1 Viral late transcription elongation factor [Sea otter poxvirus]
MPFRELILFNLIKYIVTSDEDAIQNLASLMLCFGNDVVEQILSKFDKKYYKQTSHIRSCRTYINKINVYFTDSAIEDIVTFKLMHFSHIIKPCIKLSKRLKGIVTILHNHVYVYDANDQLLELLLQKYSPQMYTYSATRLPIVKFGAKTIICGVPSITYLTYILTNVSVNCNTRVVVTKKCVKILLYHENRFILQSLFNKGSGIINESLKHMFYFLSGGHSPYFESSITRLNSL